MKRYVAFMLASTLALTACGKKNKRDDGSLVTDQAPREFLASVPSDTPYAIAALDPFPMSLAAPWVAGIRKEAWGNDQELEAMMQDEFFDAGTKALVAISSDISKNFSKAGFEERGLSWSPRVALYGLGFLPALKFEIGDPVKFSEYFTSIETKAGLTRRTEKLGEKEFWTYELAGQEDLFVMAIVGRHVRMGLTEKAIAPRFVEALLSDDAEGSIAKTGAFDDIAKTWGFERYSVGFIDLARIGQIILDPQPGLNGDVFKALEESAPEVSDACRRETTQLLAKAPRVVFGYESWTAEDFTFSAAVELPDGLGADLASTKTTAPLFGSSQMQNGQMTATFGFNVGGVLQVAQQRIQSIQSQPFQCEWFAIINRSADEVAGKMMFIPPLVSQIEGGTAILSDVVSRPPSPTQVPPDSKVAPNTLPSAPMEEEVIHGVFAISTPSPVALFDFIKSFDEQTASMTVSPDGVPVSVPVSPNLDALEFAQVVMTPNALAVTSGEGVSAQDVGQGLSTPAKDSPFVGLSVNPEKKLFANESEMSLLYQILQGRVDMSLEPSEAGLRWRTHGRIRRAAP